MTQVQKEKVTRKSTVKKYITRSYNVKKYEQLTIMVEQEHEIEWSDIAELQNKSKNVNTLLCKDFEDTKNKVFEELKINGSYNAFVEDVTEKNKKEAIPDNKDFDTL